MENIYKKMIGVLIVTILFVSFGNSMSYASILDKYRKYPNPSINWSKEIKSQYKSVLKGKKAGDVDFEEAYNAILKSAWNKIRTYDKEDLEKKRKEVNNRNKEYMNNRGNGTDDIMYYVSNTLEDAIPKLQKGKYNSKTDYTKIAKTLEESKKDISKNFQEQATRESEDEKSDEEASVGSLPERKLGLDTDQKTASAKEKSPDEIIKDADGFLNKGTNKEIDEKSLKNTSNTVYNILLGIAIALAIIIGAGLGITFMLAGSAGKAKVKESLIPYAVGCFVAFGAFGIWKLVVTILNQT